MRKRGLAYRIGPRAHEWLPRSLRGRLVVVSVLFGVLAATATFALTYTATKTHYDSLSETVAIGQLNAFRTFLEIEQSDAGRLATALGDVWERRRAEAGPSASAPSAAWLADTMREGRLTALVAAERDAETVAGGPAAQVEALRSLLSSSGPSGRKGVIWVDGVCLTVASGPITDASGLIAGRIAVARRFDASADSRFVPLAEHLSLRLAEASSAPSPAARSIAGFPAVAMSAAGSVSRMEVRLPSIIGTSAGTAVLTIRDERLARSAATGTAAALVSSLVVGLLGALLGLTLSAGVRAPIDRLREHLRDQAPHALAGRAWEALRVRPETSDDFRELTTEIDELLDVLAKRQGELVRATEEALAAGSTLRAVLDDSPEGKLLVEDGHIVLANRAAEIIVGIPAGELIGMPTTALALRMPAYNEDGERLGIADLRAVVEKPLVARMSIPDTEDRWLFVRVIPDAAREGRLLVSAHDITEDRRLDALREEVFSLVSHDLRTPLTVVRGYLDILDRPLQPEARERAIASARYNAKKMADLLEDLLDATSAEELLSPKELVPVELASLAREVAASMQLIASQHEIVVAAPGPVIVAGEAARLRQALVNLVSNAVKYAPEGTVVTVRAEAHEGTAVLAVEDEGPGIPPEARDAVFERYGRVTETCAGKPGFGLGLYIVRLIAANHGGRARVEDAPGGGARFVIELPLAAAPVA